MSANVFSTGDFLHINAWPWAALTFLNLLTFSAFAESLDDEGVVAFHRGDIVKVESVANRTKARGAPSWAFHAGHAAELRGELREAAKFYRQYLAARVDSVYREESRLKAATILAALKRKDDESLPHYLNALNHRLRGEFDDAIAASQGLADKFPKSSLADDALFLAGLSQFIDLGQHQGAIETFKRLLKRFPKSNYVSRTAFALGNIYGRTGNVDAARRELRSLIEMHSDGSGPRDTLVSRIWYRKATDRLALLERRMSIVPEALAQPFHFGIGSRLTVDLPVGSGENYRALWHLVREADLPVTHLTHWLTRQTKWRWERKQQLIAASRAGFTPVIAYWYFGDEISPKFVKENRKQYLAQIREQLIPLIKDLPEVLILLEPEFNKSGIGTWAGWDDVATEAIRIIKESAAGAKVGLTFGDFGRGDLSKYQTLLKSSIPISDFVGFMEMRSAYDATFRLDPSATLVESATLFAEQLHQSFGKPVYLGYVALSTANGWERKQAQWLNALIEQVPILSQTGVFGMSLFSMFDDPRHVGWFADAERSFGVFDHLGEPKPAAAVWRRGARQHAERDRTAPNLRGELRIDSGRGGVTGQGRLDEWARWTIDVIGRQSRARRQFLGAGARIAFQWFGDADHGHFAAENCAVVLTLVDHAGNTRRLDNLPDVQLRNAPRRRVLETVMINPGRNAHAWDRSLASLRKFGYKEVGHTEMRFAGGISGANVDFETPLDLAPAAAQNAKAPGGFLALAVRFEGTAEGFFIGLEDADGVRTDVRAEAYMNPEPTRWQRLNIPLTDFPSDGLRFASGDNGTVKPVNWRQLKRLVFSTRAKPIQVNIKDVQFSYVSRAAESSIVASGPPIDTAIGSGQVRASRSSAPAFILSPATGASLKYPSSDAPPSAAATKGSDGAPSQPSRGLYPRR
ncbi:MAG: tetratricopeptide repeat protein [Pseudomonadota bacterium]